MPNHFDQYAISWVPQFPDPLAQFGAAWTGWCAERGERRERMRLPRLGADLASITDETARHGFHGVLFPPFRLAAGRSFWTLQNVIEELGAESLAVMLPRLRVAVVDRRVVLAPEDVSPPLDALLTRISEAITPLVGGLGDEAVGADRPHAALFVDTGGNDPIVKLREMRASSFQAPLTDPLAPDTALSVAAELRRIIEPVLDAPRVLGELALMGDPGENRPRRVLDRYPLRETPPSHATAALACQGPTVLVNPFWLSGVSSSPEGVHAGVSSCWAFQD
jgi:hypothetical protein